MSATPNPLNSLLESRMQNKVAAHRALLWANCPASFRDGPKDQTRNLEIPGSLVTLAPRNDVYEIHAKATFGLAACPTRGSNPCSIALICNARYFELIRHCARLPAMNHRPGCGVRVYMLRNSCPSPNPQIGPARAVISSPNSRRTRCSQGL